MVLLLIKGEHSSKTRHAYMNLNFKAENSNCATLRHSWFGFFYPPLRIYERSLRLLQYSVCFNFHSGHLQVWPIRKLWKFLLSDDQR